jgi:hypothetical protein
LRLVVREGGEAEKSRRVKRLAAVREEEEETKTLPRLGAVREAEEETKRRPARPVPQLEVVREEARAEQAVRFARLLPMVALGPAREEGPCPNLRETRPSQEAERVLATAMMEEHLCPYRPWVQARLEEAEQAPGPAKLEER